MNKYQEALNNITFDILNCGNCDGDNDKIICKTKCLKFNDIYTLQKLVDKEIPIELETTQNEHLGIDYVCKCGNIVQKYDNYCSECGQRLGGKNDEQI